MTAPVLYGDFETRSPVDLKVAGLGRHSVHPLTEALMKAWAFDDEPIALWQPGMPLAPRVRQHIEAGGIFVAHNAQFELAIWNEVLAARFGWPRLRPEQVRCTMAACYAMGLPGALENAAHALGLKVAKDTEGRALMLKMCKPRGFAADGTPIYHDSPEMRARLGEYCKTDVVVEREIYKRVLPLSDQEQRIWTLDQEINRRGVPFDMASLQASLDVADVEKERLNEDMARVTERAVTACSALPALKEWAADYGVMPDGLAKAEIGELLDFEKLPEPVRAALKIRQSAGRFTSISKLKAIKMREIAGRVRYMFQYHAATNGRWAGRGVQPHNFPKDLPAPKDVEEILRLVREGSVRWLDMAYGEPSIMISKSLRGFIHAAPGNKLIGGDYSNVEARGLAWLAGEEWKLQAYRDYDAGIGPDLYIVAAAKIYNASVSAYTKSSPEREIGKRSELAFGYAGGKGAWRKFESFATKDYVPFSDDKIDEIKVAWRNANPKIKQYWKDLQKAAINAVVEPGAIVAVGAPGRQVHFRKRGSFLWCRLPSGRVICYPYPVLLADDFGPCLTFKGVPDAVAWAAYARAKEEKREFKSNIVDDPTNVREWCRMKLHGGVLAGNITPAICRDLLVNAMLLAEKEGFPVVLHVHDELVAEGQFNEEHRARFELLMKTVPSWARDFPIAAECWLSERYVKG